MTQTRRTWVVWMYPLIAFQAIFFFLPMAMYLRLAVARSSGPGQVDAFPPTLDTAKDLLTDPLYLGILLRTLYFGVIVVAVCLFFAIPLAYVISRTGRFGNYALAVVMVSTFTSAIIKILGWRVLLAESGPVNDFLTATPFFSQPLPLADNMAAMVIGTAHAVVPYTVVILVPVMDTVSVDLEHAAAGLGATWSRTVLGVIIPVIGRGILGCALLSLAMSMGSFTTPALMGGVGDLILPTAIYQQTTVTVDYPAAAVLSLMLISVVLVITAVALFWSSRRSPTRVSAG